MLTRDILLKKKEIPYLDKIVLLITPVFNADGNEMGGLKMPEITVPLATYTGWNLYSTKYGPAHEIAHMSGSYIPFASSRAEREANNDPRPSIAERYDNRQQYLGLVAESAMELIKDGYLLDEDLPEILQRARQHWDYRLVADRRQAGAAEDETVCTISKMGKDCGF